MLNNLRFAARQLRRSPTFAIVSVLSLAIGIGATSAMFSVADALLLRPLPVPHPGGIIDVQMSSQADPTHGVSRPDFEAFSKKNTTFESMVAFKQVAVGYRSQADSMAHLKGALLVSGNFFDGLSVRPAIGRSFRPDEDQAQGRDAVAVLSHAFWMTEFGGNPSVLGQGIRVNGLQFTVVGVAPEEFTGMDQFYHPHLYIPLPMAAALGDERLWDQRDRRSLSVSGRLKPGMTVEQAQADLGALAKALEQENPNTNRGEGVLVRTEFRARVTNSPVDTALVVMLMSLALCVLAVACANVAGLLLSRARARSREIAIRLAIGAKRSSLVRQLLLESFLLAVMGGAAGIGIGYAGVRYFALAQTPTDLPASFGVQMDGRMLSFTLLASLLSTLLFGLVPALRTTKTDLVPSLKSADADSSGKRTFWGRNALVVGQVSVSMALLVVSGLLFRGFTTALTAGPGFRTDHLLMMSFDPSLVRSTPEQTAQFYKRLVDDARQISGVQNAALSFVIPMSNQQHGESIIPQGFQLPVGQESVSVFGNIVTPGYFETMGVPVLEGRGFSQNDRADTDKVAVINQVLAQKYFPGQDPVGRRLRLNNSKGPLLQIVGLARTSKVTWIGESPTELLYLPLAQNPHQDMTLLVQTNTAEAASMTGPVTNVVRNLDQNQPVFDVRTMRYFYDKRATLVADIVINTVGILGLMGLALAMVGLYGLVAHSVGRRTREIGLRMAIGADRFGVQRMVLSQGLVLAFIGVGVGLGLSWLAARALSALIPYGGASTSLLMMLGAAVLMILITVGATYAPARRASLIDPMRALRDE
jgi:macrolide transport system ATP-binding/permease protein